jgi:hypothetical protein
METIKQGDSLPITGRIEIRELNEDTGFYEEITDTIDFSTWDLSCQVKDKTGTVIVTVPLVFIDGGPVFSEFVDTAAWVVGSVYRIDVRFRDELMHVNSSATREVKVIEAISVLP